MNYLKTSFNLSQCIKLAIVLVSLMLGVQPALALDSKSIFQQNESRVLQIRVLNQQTGKKSSIGSGFIVGDEFHIATNYHVISQIIRDPDLYYISYLGTKGEEGKLKLVGLDVAHDLALLQSETAVGQPVQTSGLPPQGAPIFAMGNPLDLGLNIAVGTNGGILNQTDDSRILFSGSLNSGMSGGPTFNDTGEVIGINVATARNDISFIVPSRYLETLINAAINQPLDYKQLKETVANQVIAYEKKYLQRIINSEWPALELRKLNLPGAISPTVRCWDNSSKLDADFLYRRFQIQCANKNHIYLDSDNRFVGDLIYDYFWIESEKMNQFQFASLYEKLNKDQIDSKVGKEQVSNFNCDVWFVDISSQEFKANLCRREYVEYPGLSDVLFTAALVGHEKKGFFVTLILTATDYQSSLQLIQKFIERVEWKN